MHGYSILVASALATLLASAGPAHAQDKPRPQDEASKKDEDGSRQVTAEDVLRALQRQRPLSEVIPPASRANKPASSSKGTLRPEGSTIAELSGSISHQGEWWVFNQECTGPCPPFKVLPNSQLEMMVRTMEGASEPLSFIVSGEITVFDGENYLLVKYAARAGRTIEAPTAPSPPPQVRADASAEDVLAKLQTQQPDQSVIPHPSGDSPAASRRAPADARALILDGSPIVNRPGRLVRDGSWWTMVFESDRREGAEPPMRLLPNQALDLMVRTSQRSAPGPVFIISGEATLYGGDNYLMTRSVTQRLDLGNLRR